MVCFVENIVREGCCVRFLLGNLDDFLRSIAIPTCLKSTHKAVSGGKMLIEEVSLTVLREGDRQAFTSPHKVVKFGLRKSSWLLCQIREACCVELEEQATALCEPFLSREC